jgi:hypothetical protein
VGQVLLAVNSILLLIELWQSCPNPVVALAIASFFIVVSTALVILISNIGVLAPALFAGGSSPIVLLGLAAIFGQGVSLAVQKLKNASGC